MVLAKCSFLTPASYTKQCTGAAKLPCDSASLSTPEQVESSSAAASNSEQQAVELRDQLGAVQERVEGLQEAYNSMAAEASTKAARLAHLEGKLPITAIPIVTGKHT